MQPLKNKIALVAGATRSAGRGIACMLGEAGATVYCTGRSVRSNLSEIGRPETIEETAELLGVSPTTVKREWRIARLWLLRELKSE